MGSRKRDRSAGGTPRLDEKRVRFEPSARLIPDVWFGVLAEDVRFPPREAEERRKSKLLSHTIHDVAFGKGGRGANEKVESETSEETECEPEVGGESSEEEETIEEPPRGAVGHETTVGGEGNEPMEVTRWTKSEGIKGENKEVEVDTGTGSEPGTDGGAGAGRRDPGYVERGKERVINTRSSRCLGRVFTSL